MAFRNDEFFKTGKTKAPCKDCPDRKQGCHSICERYQAYSNERRDLYERNKYVDFSLRPKRRS